MAGVSARMLLVSNASIVLFCGETRIMRGGRVLTVVVVVTSSATVVIKSPYMRSQVAMG